MRKLFTVPLVLLFGSVLACSTWKTRNPVYADLPWEIADTFSWFDGLGFPDVKGRPFVRVTTGGFSQLGNKPREYHRQDAFLLEEKNNRTFTVLMLDLSTVTFQETTEETERSGKVFFEEISLEEEATKRLDILKHPPEEEDSMRRFGERITERAELFVLAWACARNGLLQPAMELYELSSIMPPGRSGWSRRKNQRKNTDFRKSLEQDIGHALMWRAVVACGDPAVSREELLANFENIIRHYPSSPHIPRAEKMAGLLRQMIQEDDKDASQKPKPLNEMTDPERAAELIFQLREQNGQQWSQPGSCDIFMDYMGETNTPAHQLVAMGYAAVPQLIEALDDERLTRSVGYHRNFYFSHHILRVGDCALAVLGRISGRSFHTNATPSGCMATDEQVQATKEQVQAWWKEVTQKGEKQILIEGTVSGNRDAPLQAEALLEKYPAVALEAIAQGIRNADESWVRTRLVEIATQIPGEDVNALLLEEMETAPFLAPRVSAAAALLMRTNEMAIPAMIREWNAFQTDSRLPDDDFDSGLESLIGFLVSCDSPAALKALAAGLTNHPVDMRMAVVFSLTDEGGFMSAFSSGGGLFLISPDFEGHSLDPDTLAETEALLVAALEDTGERSGTSMSWGSREKRVSFSDPRICDVAGSILATRWPDTYDFTPATSRKSRNRQRIECINAWRHKQELPPLPLPDLQVIVQAPKTRTAPLIRTMLKSPEQAGAEEAMNKLEQLGLPALPAVNEALERFAGHPLHEKAEALASRLSCITAKTSLPENPLPMAPELAGLLQETEGRPLTSDSFAHLLETMVTNRPQKAKGVRLSAWKDDDLTGVTVRAELVEHPEKEGGGSATMNDPHAVVWTWTERVTLNGANLHNSSGVGKWDGADKGLRKAIDEALAAGPTDYFRISVRLAQIN